MGYLLAILGIVVFSPEILEIVRHIRYSLPPFSRLSLSLSLSLCVCVRVRVRVRVRVCVRACVAT